MYRRARRCRLHRSNVAFYVSYTQSHNLYYKLSRSLSDQSQLRFKPLSTRQCAPSSSSRLNLCKGRKTFLRKLIRVKYSEHRSTTSTYAIVWHTVRVVNFSQIPQLDHVRRHLDKMEMPVETPKWLDACWMQKILRKSEGDDSIHVIDMTTRPATNKGDNYTSDMIRATVEYTQDQGGRKVTTKKSVIVKIAPVHDGMRKDLILKSPLFDTEMDMMSNTLVKMNHVLKPKHLLSAKCLYIQKKDPPLLVLEDLAPYGFRMADREAGLDLAHCILALRGLARFHASSVAVCEKDPSVKQLYPGGMFDPNHPTEICDFFTLSVKSLAEEIKNWPELDPKYSKKMLKLSERLYNVGSTITRSRDNDFNVINHGDFWVNNMLFKYNDGKPIDHIFVDFQIAVYTSPAIDLLYFLNTSPSVETIENNKDVLLNEYLNTLSSTMKEIGCKRQPPTMEKLKESLKERAAYGMIASLTILPIVVCEKDNVKDFDEIMSKDGGFENPGYKGKLFRKIITKRIPLYEQMGLLDDE